MKTYLIAGLLLVTSPFTALADGMPPVPADYPSHKGAGGCVRTDLAERLQNYNETRLQLAPVMRQLANKSDAAPESRKLLLGYAATLDQMRDEMPVPDPDSDAFRNFDFRLGMLLTSMTLFLNTEDEHITQHFLRDRDNPESELGRYLVRLDRSRADYMTHLEAASSSSCGKQADKAQA